MEVGPYGIRMWMETVGLLKLHEDPGLSWMALVRKALEVEKLREFVGLGGITQWKRCMLSIHKV